MNVQVEAVEIGAPCFENSINFGVQWGKVTAREIARQGFFVGSAKDGTKCSQHSWGRCDGYKLGGWFVS